MNEDVIHFPDTESLLAALCRPDTVPSNDIACIEGRGDVKHGQSSLCLTVRRISKRFPEVDYSVNIDPTNRGDCYYILRNFTESDVVVATLAPVACWYGPVGHMNSGDHEAQGTVAFFGNIALVQLTKGRSFIQNQTISFLIGR